MEAQRMFIYIYGVFFIFIIFHFHTLLQFLNPFNRGCILGILFFGYFYFFFLGFRVIWHKIVFFCLIHLNNGWILSIHFFVIPLLLIYSSVIYYDILEKKIIVLMNIFLETILHFMLFITGIWKPALKVAKEGKTLIRNDWKWVVSQIELQQSQLLKSWLFSPNS